MESQPARRPFIAMRQSWKHHGAGRSLLVRRLRDRLMVETKLRKEAEALCLVDPLTGAFNRRGLEMKFGEEKSKAQRFQRKLFILFFDVDDFKAFNTNHGQLTGDIVLREVIAAVRSSLRPYDSVHRLGGEEFGVLLPEMRSVQEACIVAERIRAKVEGLRVAPHDGADALGVTISIGIAQYGGSEPLDGLIDHANQAEMEAKKAGKNRVFVYAADGNAPAPAMQ